MEKILALAAACLITFACANNNNRNIVTGTEETGVMIVDDHNVLQDGGVDFAGTYKGSLPCADCGGIDVELKLNRDGRYRLRTKHISDRQGEKDIEAEYDGVYSWNVTTTTVTLNGITNQPNKYMYSDGTFIQLDLSGKRIEGPLADKYVLRK